MVLGLGEQDLVAFAQVLRPQAWATRFMDSVVPRVKIRPLTSGAPRNRATLSRDPS